MRPRQKARFSAFGAMVRNITANALTFTDISQQNFNYSIPAYLIKPAECREFKSGSATSDGIEAILIEQLYLPPFGAQQAIILKTGEHPTHGLLGHAEIIADIAA